MKWRDEPETEHYGLAIIVAGLFGLGVIIIWGLVFAATEGWLP